LIAKTTFLIDLLLLCEMIPEIPDQRCAAGSLSVRVQDNMEGARLVSSSNFIPSPPGSRRGSFLWDDPEFAAAT
jgi:hypothetical protein